MTSKIILWSILSAFISASAVYTLLEGEYIEVPKSAKLPNGMIFKGQIVDGVFSGQGELTGVGKERYLGVFENGLIDGKGEYWDEAGNHYVGTFVEGSITGQGVFTFVDGGRYEGAVVAGEFKGKGSYTMHNGDVYEGEFANSLFDGKGKLTEGPYSYFEGTFRQGQIVEGIHRSDGGTYEGEFKNWFYEGKGSYWADHGIVYKGQFQEGSLTGKGSIKHDDGTVYEGDIVDWAEHGQGVRTEANGDVYTGAFEYGQYQGEGELKLAETVDDISIIKGTWSWGTIDNDPRDPPAWDGRQTEALLYSQPNLIRDAGLGVTQNDKNKIELYSLAIAGYGKQDVFRKEVLSIKPLLDSENYALGRSMYLINNYDTVEQYPLATKTSIQLALEALSNKMDVNQDILLMYLTSHGSSEHEFSLRLRGISLPDLTAEDLAEVLHSVPIRWKVIVVSACYSGGFIPALQDDDTMVITAARHDRKSFGCGDDSEMTYFGEAFFKEALPTADSFESAFKHAETLIKAWENEKHPNSEHSEPQMHLGPNIAEQLARWRKQSESGVNTAQLEP